MFPTKPKSSVLLLMLGWLVLFTSGKLMAQHIQFEEISNEVICAGNTVEIIFEVTNGDESSGYFTTATNYTIILGTGTYDEEEEEIDFSSNHYETFNVSSAPSPNSGQKKIINYSYTIPDDIPPGTDYQFLITSNSPEVKESIDALSPEVEILQEVERPVVTSDNPIREGETIRLYASTIPGATYSWTGPNGFTSNEQNPIIEDATLEMSGEYAVKAIVNGCESDLRYYTITISTHISNNFLESSFENTGVICQTEDEDYGSANPGLMEISAPSGTIFTEVRFASYGLPEGSCGNFRIGSCHSNSSQAIVEEYLIGKNSASIPAQNEVFGDPCIESGKRLYVEAVWSEFVCSGSDAGVISGTLPTGGTGEYSYLWESSTTGSSEGFSPAAGTNNTKDYEPGVVEETTWYRRTVTSGNYSPSVSPVLLMQVQKNEWTGASNRNWHNPSNWGCQEVPGLDSKVVIPSTASNFPRIYAGEPAEAGDLLIESGALLEIENNELRISGEIVNNGRFDSRIGTITMLGAEKQQIPAETFVNNQIQNLMIDNAAGVHLEGPLGITEVLKVISGNFHSEANLTLLSDRNQTALIDGSGDGEVLGTVHMQRYLNSTFGIKLFSTPFRNSIADDFLPYLDPDQEYLLSYNLNMVDAGLASGWQEITSANTALDPLEGYGLNSGSFMNENTVEISGIVNNGLMEKRLSGNAGGFYLLGNPYPSPVDWNADGWTKKDVDGALYFFEAGNSDSDQEIFYSYVNGVQSHKGKGSPVIPAMHGFFVHVSDAESGMIQSTNEVRINDPSSSNSSLPPPAYPLIRLTAGFQDETPKDPMVVYFASDATEGFNKEGDARKMMNSAENVPSIYSIANQQLKLSINALPALGTNFIDTIPLGIQLQKEGQVLFRLQDVENIPSDVQIYLSDEEDRVLHNLRENPEYNFEADKTRIDNRFYLLFSEIHIPNPGANDPLFTVENSPNWRVRVKMDMPTGQSGLLRISAVSGQILEVLDVSAKETVEIKGIKSTGVYFITLLTEGKKYAKQILVQK